MEVLCNAAVYKNQAGLVQGVFISARDITDRKLAEDELKRYHEQLEEMVIQRTSELEAVNKELETFSYSVSHDLRAPLRAIDGFSQVVINKYSDRLPDEGRAYLERVRMASQRMSILIDDLLSLSRLSLTQMTLGEVNLSDLANDVVRELREAEPDRIVETSVAEGLVARGDKRMIRIILENLVGNAWKFTGKKTDAVIQIGAKIADGRISFFVCDNGAGFDMAYADKLFRPFQRLHSSGDFEGTGIGLATVQRLVHRQGGSMRAEGKVDAGATFIFTLGASGEEKGSA